MTRKKNRANRPKNRSQPQGEGPTANNQIHKKETFSQLCDQLKTALEAEPSLKNNEIISEALPDIESCKQRADSDAKSEPDEGPQYPDVFADLSMELLPHVSKNSRELISKAFALISHKIDAQSIKNIIDVIQGTNDNLDTIEVASDQEESDDDENVAEGEEDGQEDGQAESEEESEDDDDEESEEDDDEELDEVGDDFRLKLMMALGSATDDAEDEETPMSDSEIEKVDAALAAVFKERKRQKTEARDQAKDLVQVRIQALTLLDGIARNKETSLAVIRMLAQSLVTVISQCSKQTSQTPIREKAISILGSIAARHPSKDHQNQDLVEAEWTELLDEAWKAHAKIPHNNGKDTLRKLIRWLVATLKRNGHSDEKLIALLMPRINQIMEKSSPADIILAKELIENNPPIAREICTFALARMKDQSLRPFKRHEAMSIVAECCKAFRNLNNKDPLKVQLFRDIYLAAIDDFFRMMTGDTLLKPSEVGSALTLLSAVYSALGEAMRKELPDFATNHEKLRQFLTSDESKKNHLPKDTQDKEDGDEANKEGTSNPVTMSQIKRKLDKHATKALKHLRQPLVSQRTQQNFEHRGPNRKQPYKKEEGKDRDGPESGATPAKNPKKENHQKAPKQAKDHSTQNEGAQVDQVM